MNWKSPPADTSKVWLNKSLELQVLLSCNWDCPACDQFSQFPRIAWIKGGRMTLDQVGHFVREMQESNSFIGRCRILGGEPTLHPELVDIVRLLHDGLVNPGHMRQIEIITNGTHPERIAKVDRPLRVRVSGDGDKRKHHIANMIHTPASLGYEGKICSAPWHCGISLNRYGFYPCSAGAGIARLRSLMQWQRMTLPTTDKPCNAVRFTWPDLQHLCDLCYHALRPEHKQHCGLDADKNHPSAEVAPMLDEWLGGKQPDWGVYGQEALESEKAAV